MQTNCSITKISPTFNRRIEALVKHKEQELDAMGWYEPQPKKHKRAQPGQEEQYIPDYKIVKGAKSHQKG